MKIRLNPVVEGFKHKLGNLVFYERGDETFARRLGDYRDAKSPAQMAVREAFSELASVWKSMSGLMQRSWKEFSRNRKSSGSGYNAFMGRNTRLQREGNPITLFQSMGEDRLEGFAASTGASSGEIECVFQPVTGGRHITVFLQKRENGLYRGALIRHDAGAGAVSPVVISGLEPGAEYALYAVVTDYEYAHATTVSASASATAAAGA